MKIIGATRGGDYLLKVFRDHDIMELQVVNAQTELQIAFAWLDNSKRKELSVGVMEFILHAEMHDVTFYLSLDGVDIEFNWYHNPVMEFKFFNPKHEADWKMKFNFVLDKSLVMELV